MFGKPEWFRDKRFGLRPVAWQGWLYTAVWAAVISAPSLMLLADRNGFGAGVWLTAMIAALAYDVRQIKQARHAPPVAAKKKEPVLYIGDDDLAPVSTKNLDLHLRR